jgi:hypothetical protein
VSFAHRYTARPVASTRTVPAEDLAVVMTVPPDALAPLLGVDAPAPVGEAGAAAPVLLLPALLHAATSSAALSAPPTPTATFARPDTRLNVDFPIVLSSCPARSPASSPHKSLSIYVRAKRRKGLLLTVQLCMIRVTI